MALPKQVKAAGDKADDIIRSQNEQEPNPEFEPEKSPEPELSSEPETSPEPEPEPKPSPDYEQQYRTLKGKYDAEVPRLYAEIADLKIQIAELQKNATDNKAQIEIPKSLEYVRKEMPELEEAIVYLANQIAEEKIKEKIADSEAKINNIEQTTIKTAFNSFIKYMDDNVPNWRIINEDQDFLEWLKQPDRYTGIPKFDLLQNASNKFDGPTVATFFLDYIESKKPTVKPKIDKFVSPPKGSEGGNLLSKESETITREQIRQFYNDVAAGKYKYNPEEKKKREAQINEMIARGAVI